MLGKDAYFPLQGESSFEKAAASEKHQWQDAVEGGGLRRRDPSFFLEPRNWLRFFMELQPRPAHLKYSVSELLKKLTWGELKRVSWNDRRALFYEFRGNVKHAMSGYAKCMWYKLRLFVLLTLGVWTEELFDAMEIDALASRFDDVGTQLRHEEVMRNIGLAHSLLWQFVPGAVFIAKLGEACSASPCFIFAARARLETDVQDRIDLYILSIAEFLATFAFACRPNAYWLWFAFGIKALTDLKDEHPDWFELIFHGGVGKSISYILGLPIRPRILWAEQIGYWAHIRFQIPSGLGTGSHDFSDGFDILTHAAGTEVGVPRMHIGSSATAREVAQLADESLASAATSSTGSAPKTTIPGKPTVISVLIPIRSTSCNVRIHPSLPMQTPCMPPQSDARCEESIGFPKSRRGELVEEIPEYLEPASTVSFRIAALNGVGRGAFSNSFEIELRTPRDEDFDRAKQLLDAATEAQFNDLLAKAEPKDEPNMIRTKLGQLLPSPVDPTHTWSFVDPADSSKRRYALEATPQLEDTWVLGHVPTRTSEANAQQAINRRDTLSRRTISRLAMLGAVVFACIYLTYWMWVAIDELTAPPTPNNATAFNLTMPLPAPLTHAIGKGGLVASYSFDGADTYNDSVGASKDCIAHGAQPAPDRYGTPLRAIYLDGINSHLRCPLQGPQNASLVSNDRTVCM